MAKRLAGLCALVLLWPATGDAVDLEAEKRDGNRVTTGDVSTFRP